MARPWIKVEPAIVDHPKTHRLAKLWGCHPYQVVGFLVALWGYCLEYQEDGNVDGLPREVLDEFAAPCGTGSGTVRDTLQQVGLVDADGRLHDWDEYTGELIERRRRDRERKRLARAGGKQHVRWSGRGQVEDVQRTSGPRVEQSRVETTPKSKALVELRSTPCLDTAAVEAKTATQQTRERGLRLGAEVVFAYWHARLGKTGRVVLDKKRESRIVARLRENGGDVSELLYAIDGTLRDDFLMGRDPKAARAYSGIETIFRDRAQVERLSTAVPNRAPQHPFLEAQRHDPA